MSVIVTCVVELIKITHQNVLRLRVFVFKRESLNAGGRGFEIQRRVKQYDKLF